MIRWFWNVLKALLLLLALTTALAFVLPEHRQVSRSLDIDLPAERLWPWLSEPRRWPAWSPWFAKDPAMSIRLDGPASGAGAQWSWSSSTQGQGTMRFEEVQPLERLLYTLNFTDLGSSATGEIRLDRLDTNRTRVEWTFEIHLGSNPLRRWFGIGLDTWVGRDFEAGLARLALVAAQP